MDLADALVPMDDDLLDAGDAGIRHGRQLLALAEALVRGAPPLAPARAAAAEVLDAEELGLQSYAGARRTSLGGG